MLIFITHYDLVGGGWGAFLRWWPPSTMWVGPLIFFMVTTGDVWIIPSFRIWGLCAACWAHSMCHHHRPPHTLIEVCGHNELWPTSVSHPYSFLNSGLGLAGGKHYQRVILQNFAIPCYFPYILFYRHILSLLSSGWFVIAVCGSVSVRELVK